MFGETDNGVNAMEIGDLVEAELSMDFNGMSIGEIETKMEMAILTANDHFSIANECRMKLRQLKGD
jgi:hypothetical protein